MEPKYARPDPAIPASWPVGDPYLAQAEVGLPVLTYQQVFQDPRLQTLIAQALVNNRDLMVAASNIASAREQYRIQRAQQLADAQLPAPERHGRPATSQTTSARNYQAGVSVPSFELDLFGRVRSLTPCPARAISGDRSGSAGDPADPRRGRGKRVARLCRGFEPAADRGANRCQRAKERQADPHPARRRSRAAHRPQPGRANPRRRPGRPRATAHGGRAGRQCAPAAGRRADRPEAVAGSIDEAFGKIAPVRPASIPTCCCAGPTCSRPNIGCAPPTRRSAPRAPLCSRGSR